MRFSNSSRLLLGLVFALALAAVFPMLAAAQEGPLDPAQPKNITTDEIIHRFAAREKDFEEARDHYTYRQDSKLQELDGDTVVGEWQQVWDVLFDDKGKRIERVVFAPQPTLQRIMVSEQDMDDLRNRLPFVLTTDEIPEYQILYVGQQQEDELHTYVFDVAPKEIKKNKRYFQGRIWVDDHDFQIVKTKGKNVPDLLPLAHDRIAIQFLQLGILTIGVVIPRFLEVLFTSSEAMDDLVGSNVFGLRRIQRPFLGGCQHGKDSSKSQRENQAQQ
jgi:hypothetical protein